MESYCFAHDAWPDDITLEDMNQHEVAQDEEREYPALAQGQQYTDHARSNCAQDRNKFQNEGQHAQQERIWHSEDEHTNAYQDANQGTHDELSANIAADDPLKGMQEKANPPPLTARHLVLQPP